MTSAQETLLFELESQAAKNLVWIRENMNTYAGLWVLLHDGEILDSAEWRDQLLNTIDRVKCSTYMLVRL